MLLHSRLTYLSSFTLNNRMTLTFRPDKEALFVGSAILPTLLLSNQGGKPTAVSTSPDRRFIYNLHLHAPHQFGLNLFV